MTRLWPDGTEITVVVDERGQPAVFDWQGRRYRLQRVQQRWQIDSDWWSETGRVWRTYLAVTTENGLFCVIYYDMLAQVWYLEKLYD